MKIKRFDNIWTMGLILFAVILVLFYVAKIFFPEFIIGVAEIPRVVEIGKFIDSSKITIHIFNIIIGLLGGCLYCCAACRKKYLKWKDILVLLGLMIILSLVLEFMPAQYSSINFLVVYCSPFILCCLNKELSKNTFVSSSVCFLVDILSQVMSCQIRDLLPMTSSFNSATMIILLIDTWIWRLLLYFFFNNKSKKE